MGINNKNVVLSSSKLDKPASPTSSEKSSKNPDYSIDKFQIPESNLFQDYFNTLPLDISIWKNEFLKFEINGRKSTSTEKVYKVSLEKFEKFYLKKLKNSDIRLWVPQVTRRYIEFLLDEGKKPSTIELRLNTLRKFSKWILQWRKDIFQYTDPLEDIKPPTQEALRPKGFIKEQIIAIVDVLQEKVDKYYKEDGTKRRDVIVSRPLRDQSIIFMMLNIGLRRQEILDLTLEQFTGKHLVNVKCKGNQYRNLLLTDNVGVYLQNYLDHERWIDTEVYPESKFLFLPATSRKTKNSRGQIAPDSINKMVMRLGKKANRKLDDEDKIKNAHPHMFRHTHALTLAEQKRSDSFIAKRLGHQSVNTTSKYTILPEKTEKEIIEESAY